MTAVEVRRDLIAQRRSEFLTVKEYAELIGRHPFTIYRRIWAGTQPGAVRDGGHWLIDVPLAIRETQRPG